MLLILAYWTFLLLFFLPAGIALNKILKLRVSNICIILLLGMIISAIGFSIAAFFTPLNKMVLLFFTLVNILLLITNRSEFLSLLVTLKIKAIFLTNLNKAVILIIFLCTLIKSAQLPTIPDNESYYIQTIKWLNEYGLVKGLANLHLFFAQTSGWHILQAGVNFSFISSRINDLNGFILIVCSFYFISESQKHSKLTGRVHWLSILPVFSALFTLFIDSPSPDLPVILIIPVIIYLITSKKCDDSYKTAYVLLLFTVFIKVTAGPLILFFLYFFYKQKHLAFIIASGTAVACLWIVKNCIISGHPLYPVIGLNTMFNWALPVKIAKGIHMVSNSYVYGTKSSSVIFKLYSWFMQPGIKGIINKLIVIILLIIPFFKIIMANKLYKLIYVTLFLQFIILLFTSPQYRFYLPQLLFFSAVVMSQTFNYFVSGKKLYRFTLVVSMLLTISGLFFYNISPRLSPVKFNSNFDLSVLLVPEQITSQPDLIYIKEHLDNLIYYSPYSNKWLYNTGNGPLPCVNKKQVRYLKKKFDVIPQMRTNSLKDGFYSKEITSIIE